MEKGYILLCDILGFSNINENLDNSTLSKKLEIWPQLVNRAATENGIQRYQLISDSVIVSANKLGTLIQFSRRLLETGLENSFPIRGALSHGEFIWGDFVYGKAVIDAHSLEIRQDWIGITLHPTIPDNLDEYYTKHQLAVYPIPRKDNDPVQLFSAIWWDIPNFERVASLLTSEGLVTAPGVNREIEWRIQNKINSTMLYAIYLRLLQNEKQNPGRFSGLGSFIHFLDLNLWRKF